MTHRFLKIPLYLLLMWGMPFDAHAFWLTSVNPRWPILLPTPITPNQSIHPPVFTLSSNALAPLKSDNASYIPTVLEVESLKASAFHYMSTHYLSGTDTFKIVGRMPYYIVSTALQYILFPSELIIHEWGHYSRGQADGMSASIGAGPFWDGKLRHNPHFWDGAILLSMHGALSGYRGYVMFDEGSYCSSDKTCALIWGAGINNESSLSNEYDEHLLIHGQGSIFNVPPVFARLGMSIYARSYYPIGDDLDGWMASYSTESHTAPVTRPTIMRIGDSTIWSGTTWAYGIGLYHYIMTGQATYSPLLYHSFLVPNQTAYLSSRGITRKVTSGYKWSPTLIGLMGVEWVEKGQPFEEYTAGIYLKNMPCGPLTCSMLSKWMLSTRGTISSELWLSTPLTPQLTLKTYLAYWDQNSLIGERHTLDYQHRHTMQLTTMVSYTPLPPQPIGE